MLVEGKCFGIVKIIKIFRFGSGRFVCVWSIWKDVPHLKVFQNNSKAPGICAVKVATWKNINAIIQSQSDVLHYIIHSHKCILTFDWVN